MCLYGSPDTSRSLEELDLHGALDDVLVGLPHRPRELDVSLSRLQLLGQFAEARILPFEEEVIEGTGGRDPEGRSRPAPTLRDLVLPVLELEEFGECP